MEDYKYDIFLSYRRSDEAWVRWTRENFARPLRSLLRLALGDVQFFIDEQIETGESWPRHLAGALGHSRVLVAVLSRGYFMSAWCRLELAHMYQREQEGGLRSTQKPSGLILPVIIDDGDSFPLAIRHMQCKKLHEFANPCIRIDSPTQEKLADSIRDLCPTIESALKQVPPFNSRWTGQIESVFEELFRISPQSQINLPLLNPWNLR